MTATIISFPAIKRWGPGQATCAPRSRLTEAEIDQLVHDANTHLALQAVSESCRTISEQARRDYAAFTEHQAVEKARREASPSPTETVLSDTHLLGYGYRCHGDGHCYGYACLPPVPER